MIETLYHGKKNYTLYSDYILTKVSNHNKDNRLMIIDNMLQPTILIFVVLRSK